MKRSFIITLALIAAIAIPLCASSGWARGLGVLGMCGGAGGGACTGSYGNVSTADAGFTGTSLNRIYLTKITIDCAGNPTISARLRHFTTDTTEAVFVVYADASGSPGARVWYSEPIYNAAWTAVTTVTTANIGSLAAGTYWVGVFVEGASRIYYSAATGGESWAFFAEDSTFPTPPTDMTGNGAGDTIAYEYWLSF